MEKAGVESKPSDSKFNNFTLKHVPLSNILFCTYKL